MLTDLQREHYHRICTAASAVGTAREKVARLQTRFAFLGVTHAEIDAAEEADQRAYSDFCRVVIDSIEALGAKED